MRVNLFADSPLERWHSMDRYARSLFKALQQVSPDLEVSLLIPPPPPFSVRGYLLILWRMLVYPLWASRHPADVYHILDHSYGHLAFGLDSNRVVVTIHDIAPLAFPSLRLGASRLAWMIAWEGTQRAAWWITISDFTHQELRQWFKRKTKISYGVDRHFRSLAEEEKSAWRKRLGRDKSKIILHVGHCQPRKNIEGLLLALALLTKQGLDFLFVQLGGIFSDSQRHLIRELGLEKRVLQISQASSEEELVGFYNLADVLVMPSLYEGFGFPALEAMACGTPVVVSQVASLPEVVGDAGLLVDPRNPQSIADAIAHILTDERLAKELSCRGLERAQKFTWEKAAEETALVYRQVLEGKERVVGAHKHYS